MKTKMNLLAVAVLLASTASAHAVSLNAGGYSESFDGMGTSGTTPPTGWSVYTGNSGTSNGTWTTSIAGNGSNSVASMVTTSGSLTATSNPTSTNNNGYNAARTTSVASDRVLATSPTTVSGAGLQLLLTNNTGYSFNEITLGYDTVRFSSVGTANELPGYQLFYSLNGTSWTNVTALNPTIATVPNSVGVTSISNASIALSSSVATGANLYLRWIDDNAKQTSPDQIIGLNNVSVVAVPEPETYALMLAGLGLLGFAARRRKG